MEQKPITLRDVIIDACVIGMTAYSVYIALDQATDGRFSRECSIRLTRIQGRITGWIKREQEFDRNRGPVIWEAINIVDDNTRKDRED